MSSEHYSPPSLLTRHHSLPPTQSHSTQPTSPNPPNANPTPTVQVHDIMEHMWSSDQERLKFLPDRALLPLPLDPRFPDEESRRTGVGVTLDAQSISRPWLVSRSYPIPIPIPIRNPHPNPDRPQLRSQLSIASLIPIPLHPQ